MPRSALLFVCGLLARPGVLTPQQPSRINVYLFVLGVDVPEPPALVALGRSPTQVLLGSAPKPLAASVLVELGPDGGTAWAAALDVTPYFLAGGGVRDLERYRSRSFAGRLARVVTKTLLSVGAARDPRDPGALLVALGLRSTFHDPHDPVLNSALPEEVAAELDRRGAEPPDPAAESVMGRGVDLSAIYARARRAMRGRSGDAQVSAGWGVSARAAGGALDGDSLGAARQTLWLAAQYTTGRHFDLLATVQLTDAFRGPEDRWWEGAAVRRKGGGADLQLALSYDTGGRDVHPSLALDARLSGRFGAVASLGTAPDLAASSGPPRVRFTILTRWFAASDRSGP